MSKTLYGVTCLVLSPLADVANICRSLFFSSLTSLSLFLFVIRYIDSSHTEIIRIGSLDVDKG